MYQPTELDLRVSRLMERVKALDPDLGRELSNAYSDQMVEAENRAVILHGQQILAAIEGRGFGSTAGAPTFSEDSRWVPALAAVSA